MMVLFDGHKAKPEVPWYAGLRLTCGVCECRVQIEAHDRPLDDGDGPHGQPRISVPCPTCGAHIYNYEPSSAR